MQTFTLDPAGSTYYYKRQMRTMGNLGDYPSFSSVLITFTFDDTWSVLRADIEEEYQSFRFGAQRILQGDFIYRVHIRRERRGRFRVRIVISKTMPMLPLRAAAKRRLPS